MGCIYTLLTGPNTSYNGGIEAAIGSLKTRTQRLADQAGHPLLWTSAEIEAARQEANAAHPRRLRGATPDEVWNARAPLTAEGRQNFSAALKRYQLEGWEKRDGKPADPSHWDVWIEWRYVVPSSGTIFFCSRGGQFPHALSGQKWQ